MNNFTLISFLTSNIEIDLKIVEELVANCKSFTVQKGEFILQEGEICKHSFFVEKWAFKTIFY